MYRALVLLLFLLIPPSPAQSANTDLSAKLVHQTLYLRGFWRGSKLKFDAAGTLIGHSAVGSFTVSGFEVEKVTPRPNALELEGERVGIRFADDMPERVTLSEHPGSKKAETIRIEIQAPTDGDYKKALDAIFATKLEDLVPSLPDYWQFYAQDHLLHPEPVTEYRPEDVETPQPGQNRRSSTEKRIGPPPGVSRIGGNVKPPVPIKMPDPKFSQEARQTRVSGNVLVYLQVDSMGRPMHVHIVRPCGMGLDEAAMEAVSRYVFKPATRDGVPVTVEMHVEVNFQIF